MTLKKIDNAIASFTTNRDKLRQQAQDIGMMIIRHAAPEELPDCVGSGDCTRAIKLIAAMPNSWQPQMAAWFKAFTPIRVVLKNGKCEYDPAYKKLDRPSKLEAWNLEAAASTPFWEVIGETPVAKEYDFAALVKLVERLGNQIEKKITEGKVKESDVESAKAIATTIAGLHFSKVTPKVEEPANEDKSMTTDDFAPNLQAVA